LTNGRSPYAALRRKPPPGVHAYLSDSNQPIFAAKEEQAGTSAAAAFFTVSKHHRQRFAAHTTS
jgi:hypothetical protein